MMLIMMNSDIHNTYTVVDQTLHSVTSCHLYCLFPLLFVLFTIIPHHTNLRFDLLLMLISEITPYTATSVMYVLDHH